MRKYIRQKYALCFPIFLKVYWVALRIFDECSEISSSIPRSVRSAA